MKKFTFMLIAAFMAVASWAGTPVKNFTDLQTRKASVQLDLQKMVPAKQMTPTKMATPFKVQAPVSKRFANKAKAGAKKTPRKASVTDLINELLTKDYMLLSEYYEYDEATEEFVEATPSEGGTPITFSDLNMQTMTININGFRPDATEPIEAKVSMDVDEELAAIGVVATANITDEQVLFESTYGPVLLTNASSEGDIKAYVFEDGIVLFEDAYYTVLGGDGQYAGYMWDNFIFSSSVLPANGTMAWVNSKGVDTVIPVFIYQDEETPKYATVFNFAGWETAIAATLKPNQNFAIESQIVSDEGSYGIFYTYGLNEAGTDLGSAAITGVGTETTLTFNSKFTAYSDEGYWYGAQGPAIITLTEGEFIYPEPLPDVAATPADPEILSVNNYDESQGYGSIFFVIPTTDVEDNDLLEDNLFYELYCDIDGEVQPITFTPDICEKLEQDMTIIPYTFTDNWDFQDRTDYKAVFLNYDFNAMYDRIGVKSIYTGGGETNESAIAWADVEKVQPPTPQTLAGDYTIDFNKMDVATSATGVTDGDITEDLTLYNNDGNSEVVALTISPAEEGKTTPNRFWNTNAGPQLRVYSGTLTFTVPNGYAINTLVFNHNGKWGANTVDDVEIPNDAVNKVATWTGSARTVVVAIAANTQINNIVVTVEEAEAEAIDPDGITYTFDDGTLGGWTTLDADGDGYTWMNTIETQGGVGAHNGEYAVFTQSYANGTALTPDNYLVSPKVKLGSTFSFFARAQDASYPAEHFGVFVSTSGKSPADFEKVEEWTLTASRADKVKLNARGAFRTPNKAQGRWYQYIVDLSEYEGQEGYVAIRHFDCTDMFYMVVDDITFGTPADPDPEPEPDELVELPEGVEPIEYTLEATGATSMSNIDIFGTKLVAFDGTDVYLQGLAYYFPDAFVKGTLTNGQVVIPSGQFVGEDEYGVEYLVGLGVDEEGYFTDNDNIVFDYDAESGVMTLAENTYYGESGTKDSDGLWDYFYEATYTPGAVELPDPVVAPEGLETETWYLACDSYNGKIRAQEVQVGFTENEVYIQGLCEYLPEAWVKGTIDGNTATFASGQYYGTFADEYTLFFVGYDYDTEEITDVVFTIDNEAGLLTTDQWIILNGRQNSINYYDYYYDVVISKEMPEVPQVVEAPEDLVAEAYQFKGFDTYFEEDETREVQVGFYGDNLVYIQGLSNYVEDAWVVGTLEGTTLTIPETYMGIYESLFGDSEVFFSGATFVYDAEAGTFTSEEGFVTYETPEDAYWMDEYSDVVLTKLQDVAATPADPEITALNTDPTATYQSVKFNIPLVGTEGEALLSSKLSYVIWIEKDGEQQILTLAADLYENLEEDMTEIPYGFSEGWDIYAGTVYFNQGIEEINSWTKVGIQSIYRGGGEENKSNIVWMDNENYNPSTGISDINAANSTAVYFDMQGRKVDAAQKGLVIMQVRKADGTVKSVKVVR